MDIEHLQVALHFHEAGLQFALVGLAGLHFCQKFLDLVSSSLNRFVQCLRSIHDAEVSMMRPSMMRPLFLEWKHGAHCSRFWFRKLRIPQMPTPASAEWRARPETCGPRADCAARGLS